MNAHASQVVGRYAIYGKIASGGMASVHFGRLLGEAGFSRTVAIKRLHAHLAEDPEFLSTMMDEAHLAARIHHPNVVPTLDVVTSEGELLVVMEYVRGESLGRLLKAEIASNRRVPLPIASAVVIGALHGLHAAHDATSDRGDPLGIVHRDVSPQNILVGVDGIARVIDFGVAKATGRLQTTREGVLKGKIAYMAPEQIAANDVTRSADVYAMAVVLWEMLAGRSLFKATVDAALVAQVLRGALERPSRYAPHLPAGLDALVMTGLAPDPADRFASAREMADALLRVLPPAFPTDVGAWVEELARDALGRRGSMLAEIESASGVAMVAPTGGGVSRSVAVGRDRERNRPGGAELATRRETVGGAEDEAPTIASQPSSLSVETPKPRPLPRWTSRQTMVSGALVGGMLLVGLAVAGLRSGSSAGSGPETPDEGRPAAEPAAQTSAVSSGEPPEIAVSALPVASTSATLPGTGPPVPPRPVNPGARQPGQAPHPAPSKPKTGCNPPFVIDENGDRQYKPECL